MKRVAKKMLILAFFFIVFLISYVAYMKGLMLLGLIDVGTENVIILILSVLCVLKAIGSIISD